MKRYKVIVLVLCFIVTSGWARQAAAHGSGETLQLSQVAVGSYALSVWTSPDYLRPGEIHFSAIVVDETQNPAVDCVVEIQITPLDFSAESVHLITGAATAVTQFKHEIAYPIQKKGQYRVTVSVVDKANSIESTHFDIEIVEISFWMKLPIYLAMLVAGGAALLLGKQALSLFNLWQAPQLRRPTSQRDD
jgi:hypothetical protein